MSEPVTSEEIAELRRLEKAAVPGPWASDDTDWVNAVDPHRMICDCIDSIDDLPNDASEDGAEDWEELRHVHAALIAAARNALPRLLGEIERLRAELAARPKLWIVRTDDPEIGTIDIGDCGDAVPCIAAFASETDAAYVAACVGGTVEEWVAAYTFEVLWRV